jgi:hypothetical protein
MLIEFTGRHTEVTPKLRALAAPSPEQISGTARPAAAEV